MNDDIINTDAPIIFSGDQKQKIKRLVEEGMRTMHEIDTLKEGLSETIKAVAEELNIKPTPLRKAIRIAHKASYHEETKNHDIVTTLLEAANKTL